MEEFYVEYGKFIINFEKINFELASIIRKICTDGNMFGKTDTRIEILLEGLTAYPLLSKFNSIISTTEILNDVKISGLVECFRKNFVQVIELRNFIAHGTFFLGDPQGNIENFEIRKPKLNKKGYHQNVNIISIDALRKLNLDVMKLEKFIINFKVYINSKSPKEFTKKVLNQMSSLLNKLDIKLDILNTSIQIN